MVWTVTVGIIFDGASESLDIGRGVVLFFIEIVIIADSDVDSPQVSDEGKDTSQAQGNNGGAKNRDLFRFRKENDCSSHQSGEMPKDTENTQRKSNDRRHNAPNFPRSAARTIRAAYRQTMPNAA